MKETEGLEELRRAFAAEPGLAPVPAECPPPESLWLAARGQLPPDALRALLDHLAACPSCTEEWRLARAFEEAPGEGEVAPGEEAPGEAIPAGQPAGQAARRPSRPLAAWMAAAGAAAALLAGLLIVPVARGPGSMAPARTALRGLPALASPRLGAAGCEASSRERCLLHWSGPAGARYAVEVSTLSGRRVASARGLSTPSFQVPASPLAVFPPGTVLSWQVTAERPGFRSSSSARGTLVLP
jgi:hypothetical protein